MDRRDFLKSAAGIFLIPVVPSLALADAPKDLKEWFEANFNCKQGELGPAITVGNETYTYHTCAAGIFDCSEDEAQKRLTHYFIEQFAPLAAGKPNLWWRVEPQFAEVEVINWGKTWMTAEEVEDGGVREDKFYRATGGFTSKKGYVPLRWKEIQKPKNVKYDFDTGSYKYTNGKKMLYRMRFRLVIPTQTTQLQALAKAEGEEIRKI